jgi:hypothetical protein
MAGLLPADEQGSALGGVQARTAWGRGLMTIIARLPRQIGRQDGITMRLVWGYDPGGHTNETVGDAGTGISVTLTNFVYPRTRRISGLLRPEAMIERVNELIAEHGEAAIGVIAQAITEAVRAGDDAHVAQLDRVLQEIERRFARNRPC